MDNDTINILRESKTIAVVGCSRDENKAAHKIPKYLKEQGYKVIPVNPSANEILGERTFKVLSDIDVPVDILNIFRPSEECFDITKEAIKIKPKVIWMQLGIKNDEAKRLAEKHNIKVIMDKCIMIEHKSLFF